MADHKRIAEVDFDESEYIGSEEDGVYYAVAEGPDGWYYSCDVDCNSANFTDVLVSDEGPYGTHAAARDAARVQATEWCLTNDVIIELEEQP
jgi:hypothetical protein